MPVFPALDDDSPEYLLDKALLYHQVIGPLPVCMAERIEEVWPDTFSDDELDETLPASSRRGLGREGAQPLEVRSFLLRHYLSLSNH